MWFLDSIVQYLGNARDWLLEAYNTVSGWIYPFRYLSVPLWYLYSAFYYLTYYFSQFNVWLDWAAGRIGAILSTFDIYSYFKTWFDYAVAAYNWVFNAIYNVWNICNTWWSSASQTVLVWVADAKNWATNLFNQANTWLASLQTAWDSFKAMIPSISEIVFWFKNWWGNILPSLTSWWNNKLLDIQSLFNSAFLARESFWAGWQDLRAEVAEFFADPFDWIKVHIFEVIVSDFNTGFDRGLKGG